MLSIRYFGILWICTLRAACASTGPDRQTSDEVPTAVSPSPEETVAGDNMSGDTDFKPLGQENRSAGVVLKSGEASWYAPKFRGRRTANGERFDARAFTAAHRTLPLGTYDWVTSMATGRSVEVRIEDRGPFVKGRIIDLSYAATQALGLLRARTMRVQIQRAGKMINALNMSGGAVV